MSAKRGITARDLLAKRNPFVLGRYPDRPAPAHVLNAFLQVGLGQSTAAKYVIDFAYAESAAANDLPPFLNPDHWAGQATRLEELREDVRSVFDPDRRAWKGRYFSFFPVVSGLVSRDPSDDGYGALLWAVLERGHGREHLDEFAGRLERTFKNPQDDPEDGLTSLASLLCKCAPHGGRCEGPRYGEAASTSSLWHGDSSSQAGTVLAESLSSFIGNLVGEGDLRAGERLLGIQLLSIGLYLATILSLMHGASACAADGSAQTVSDVGMCVVWCGEPPGPQQHPMVQAAAESFRLAIARIREANARLLLHELEHCPPPQGETDVLLVKKDQLRQVIMTPPSGSTAKPGEPDEDELRSLVKECCTDHETWSREECLDIVDRVMPPEWLAQGLRKMGRKIGFIGPDRGRGTPRFLLETPVLGALVTGLCQERERLSLTDFVDRARERLGLVLGPGSRPDLTTALPCWTSRGAASVQLKENQELLKQRLLRAGLAREYSDGLTEVTLEWASR